MLLNQANPYRPDLPSQLVLGWDDFEFKLSAANRQALGHKAQWSVLNYMVADCDLAALMFDDLLEMKRVGSSPELHLCAWFDGPLLTDGFFARLQADVALGDDLLLRFNELRLTDSAFMGNALALATAFPAAHRLLVLSGHGMGWRGMLQDLNLGMRYRHEPGRLQLPGPGEECDRRLRACQVAGQDALNAAREGESPAGAFDVMAFDACDMGNLEAIAMLAGHGRILVVSEDQVPGDGYPYAQVLGALQADLGQSPLALARALVHQTKRRYAGGDLPLTQVALDAAQLPAFAAALVRLAQSLSPIEPVFAAVHAAMQQVHRLHHSGNIDLIGFVQLLLGQPLPAPSAQAAQALLACWQRMVLASAVPGGATGANGLSIYAPPAEQFDPSYLPQMNGLPHSLGIWGWFLASYYNQLLGGDLNHPLLRAMHDTMLAMRKSGQYPG